MAFPLPALRCSSRCGEGRFRGALLLLIAALNLGAEESGPPPARRPRIGLVLGGGGAKGAAHVGVLKVLEELRVPIDCIAGTSMGSIVGAAYASGVSADELAKIMGEVSWTEVLSSAPREEMPYHRRVLDSVFTMGLEFGVKKGRLILPDGMVSTHQIEALLRNIVSKPGKVYSFNRLPIPFRAVSTDLESGAMKVFDRGDLATALRASMAVPGAFAPVEIDGRLYVDGMLVRNLPVDVARQMGAEVIIAVTVSNPPRPKEDLNNVMSVAGRSMDIAIEANEKAQLQTLGKQDTAIQVMLLDVASGDFNKIPQAIPVGETAARAMAQSLARYSLPPRDYERWRTRLKEEAPKPAVTIDEIRLVGFQVTNPDVMRTYLKTRPGEVYDPIAADRDATRLVARGDFSAVSQHLESEGDRNILVFTAKEKKWGPDYLMFDISLGTDLKGGTSWGLRGDYNKRWINQLGGEFRTTLQIGRPNVAGAEWYQPLDRAQRFFFAPSVLSNQNIENIYVGDSPTAQLNTRRFMGRLDLGTAFGNWGELRAGAMKGRTSSVTRVGDPEIVTPGRNNLGGWITRFAWDTLDKPVWPTRGTGGSLNFYLAEPGMGSEQRYRVFSGNLGGAVPFHGGVWSYSLKGGGDLGSDTPYYDQFRLGGLFNFSGYQADQMIAREYLLGLTSFRWKVATISEMMASAVYFGTSVEVGNVFHRLDGLQSRNAMVGGSLFLSLDTKIGPLCFAYGQSEGGHTAFYFYIGSSFALFRP